MQILTDTDDHIQQAAEVILSGGIVVHATETCYGLGCDLTNVEAVEKLFLIKNRPFDQPVSALFPSVEKAKEYVKWGEKAEELAKEGLPGPLTLVLKRRETSDVRLQIPDLRSQVSPHIYVLPIADLTKQPTIGIRISPHPVAIKLCALVGRPIATTSANVHGEPSSYSVEEIMAQYQNRALQPDLVLDSGELPKNASSQVVMIDGNRVTILRA